MKTMAQKETATVPPEDHPKAMSPDRAAVVAAMPERSRNLQAKRAIAVANKARAPVLVAAWNQIWKPRDR